MAKKIFILLMISFVIFVGSLSYFKFKQKQFESYLTKIKKIKTITETKELKIIKDIKVETWDDIDKKKLIEQAVANELLDVDTFLQKKNNKDKWDWINIRYQKLYISSMKKKNLTVAIKAIKKILETSKNKDIWLWKIVKLYIQVWDFKNAEKYSKQLLSIDSTKQNLKKFLYIKLQNTNFFDDEKVKDLKNLIKIYYDKKIITASELTFYYFLIDLLSDWDVKKISLTLKFLLKDLKKNEQSEILFNIKKDLDVYKNTKWSPVYYFKALVALDLLKFWYFGLAKNIAQQVYLEDSNYILPQQILAYSYFYMWNYKQALKYFKDLQKKDEQNKQEYIFFIGISYYWLNDNVNSLLYLSQIKPNFKYYLDSLRYQLLNYINIKDTENIYLSIKKISEYKLTYVDYYNIFRYLLFKCNYCYKDNIKLMVKLIKSCYKDTDKEHKYVCWYAKANLYQKAKKYGIATKYYILLTKYFQDPYIFWNIASYYESIWEKHKARLYYLKELLFTDDTWKRDWLKKKIKKLFLNDK